MKGRGWKRRVLAGWGSGYLDQTHRGEADCEIPVKRALEVEASEKKKWESSD